MSTAIASQPTKRVRHPTLYIDDGNLVMLAEHTLFRVHKSTLSRSSAFFRDMLSLPQPVEGQQDGTNDEHPLELHQVSALDMERLLRLLYPPFPGRIPIKNAEEWLSVLSVSQRYAFDSLRAVALESLVRMPFSATERIRIARDYDVLPGWINQSAVDLVLRAESLSVKEVATIGIEYAVPIFHAREIARRSPQQVCGGCDISDVRLWCDNCQDFSELAPTLPPVLDAEDPGHWHKAVDALREVNFLSKDVVIVYEEDRTPAANA